jgi:hypothetical protein
VIPDRDVWAAALLMVKRYGDDAMLEASERADQLLEEGDMAGAETWHRILNAIERLQGAGWSVWGVPCYSVTHRGRRWQAYI